MTDATCEHVEFYFRPVGTIERLQELMRPRLQYTYRYCCEQIVCISYRMQTSSRKPILNWYPFTETFARTNCICYNADHRRRHHLSSYRCLPPRNPSLRLRRTRTTRRDLAICFLSIDNTGGLTVRLRKSNPTARCPTALKDRKE